MIITVLFYLRIVSGIKFELGISPTLNLCFEWMSLKFVALNFFLMLSGKLPTARLELVSNGFTSELREPRRDTL